jgi:hypothetical protein
MAWAVFMAGGSCPVLPAGVDEKFLKDAAQMETVSTGTENYEQLVKSDTGSIIFYHKVSDFTINLPAGKYEVNFINTKTGQKTILSRKLTINGGYTFDKEKSSEGVYWFRLIR